MIEALVVGGAYCLFVFFKAIQQRNVAFMHYAWVMPVSLALSTTDVFVIATVAYKVTQMETFFELLPLVVAIGIGGGLGAMAAMYLHNKHIGNHHDRPKENDRSSN